jgi:hypothetical protein
MKKRGIYFRLFVDMKLLDEFWKDICDRLVVLMKKRSDPTHSRTCRVKVAKKSGRVWDRRMRVVEVRVAHAIRCFMRVQVCSYEKPISDTAVYDRVFGLTGHFLTFGKSRQRI